MSHARTITALLAGLVLAAAGPATARQEGLPYSLAERGKVGTNVAIEDIGSIDAGALLRTAERPKAAAEVLPTKRLGVAETFTASVAPGSHGRSDRLADGSWLWRTRLRVAGATDLRLGFGTFALPEGATLHLIGADDYYQGPYTAADAFAGRFESPVLPGDTVTIELRLPADMEPSGAILAVDRVGAGFRDLFARAKVGRPGNSGECNVNIVCPAGIPYTDEGRGVGYMEFRNDEDGNYYMCSGTLLADVKRSGRNWFLSAGHCVDSQNEANSLVVYWNYRSMQCDYLSMPSGGYFNQDQHGATLRATRADVDFVLLELAGTQPASWNLYRVGWDALGTVPAGTVGLHHPAGDVQKVTLGPRPGTSRNCTLSNSPPDTHWRTGPYSEGTTEGGSSGSGLYIPAADGSGGKRLIGMLSGGNAQCSTSSPSRPDNGNDCYGKFAAAWDGPSAASRLRDWLDPDGTGTRSIAGGDGQPPGGTAPTRPVGPEPPPIVRALQHRRKPRP